jgi:hypothetical protein
MTNDYAMTDKDQMPHSSKKPHLTLVVKLTEQGANGEVGDRRKEAFWEPLIKKHTSISAQENPPSIDHLEKRLKTIFPRHLHTSLAEFFSVNSNAESRRAAEFIPLIGIRVAGIRYGSLDLDIAFAGVKHLVQLFDGNLDVFITFAEAYLPEAFEEALEDLHFHSTDKSLSYEIQETHELKEAFEKYGGTITTHAQDSTAAGGANVPAIVPLVETRGISQRAHELRKVVNSSLILPVGLVLIALFATNMVSDEKKDLRELRDDLLNREQVLTKAAQDRIAQLEKVQGELLQLLKESAKPAERKK